MLIVPQEMDGELFMNSEQDWANASGSDWINDMGDSKGKQGGKRKMNQQNCNKKKMARSKNSRRPGNYAKHLQDIFFYLK